VSNLPTVWSNCLAGWWLGAGADWRWVLPDWHKLPVLLIGTTLMYCGGMYLNDAFDAEFDARFRRERPIPSGAISLQLVWRIGLVLLGAGAICLITLGKTPGVLALLLLLCILIYDAIHKVVTVSPIIMGCCRWLVYVIAAATGPDGLTGWGVWCGLALAIYVVGLSYIARAESIRTMVRFWPCLLLAAPIGLACIMNTGDSLRGPMLMSAVLVLWSARCLRFTYGIAEKNIGVTVGGLLAGIVWVDLIAVADCPRQFAAIFIGLFVSAVLMQRYVPAT
jgi:4-hydroxybenzoate polyprenyltransferase